MLIIIIILTSVSISINISVIIIISSSSSSSSSTQRSARGAVDEMHVFQKKVLSTRPETTSQVNSMQQHTFQIWSAKQQKLSPRRETPFRVYFNATNTTLRSAANVV